jgi:Uri superfamily endonuclease
METKVTGIDPVHELVRGLLYLCSPTNTGDREANKHARMLWAEGKNISGTIRSELLFFAAWTNSCERSYRDAVDLADLGIKSYSNDARFPYVKARSILRDLEEGDKPEREERIAEAIKLQQLAVELAHKYHPSNAWLNGAMNNALAYYLCYTDWADDAHTTRVKLARSALRRLKEEIPKERWHSNFFHTEAAVELNEALITKSAAREYEIKAELQSYPNKRVEALALASQERKNACDKLSRALTEIDRALKNSQESRFIALRKRILVELEDVGLKPQD